MLGKPHGEADILNGPVINRIDSKGEKLLKGLAFKAFDTLELPARLDFLVVIRWNGTTTDVFILIEGLSKLSSIDGQTARSANLI